MRTFNHQGYNFSATVQEDDYPHLEDESHGPVIHGLTTDKRAGYMVLKQEGPRAVYYDFAQAVRQARKENWGAGTLWIWTLQDRSPTRRLWPTTFISSAGLMMSGAMLL